MKPNVLAKYDQKVPRYTSYPTAPQFDTRVQAEEYCRWLSELDPGSPLSLYVHIPFYNSLCWFCGCHTKIVRRYAPIGAYLGVLVREIDLVADLLGPRREVSHLHLGGGTPLILGPDDFQHLFQVLHRRFEFRSGAEIAVESDPPSYVRAVRNFTVFLGRSPGRASAEDLRRYQLHLASSGVSGPSINATVSALRFFFQVTLGRSEATEKMTSVCEPRKLPVVLSGHPIDRLQPDQPFSETVPGPT